MSRPAPPSVENRDSKRQRADDSPLDSAPSEPPISVATPIDISATVLAAPTGSNVTVAAELQTQSQSLAHQSIGQRCHTDALHCIFAFLGLKELLPALHSCRKWNAAGGKEPPRGLSVTISARRVASLAASPLRHHAADVILRHSWREAASFEHLRLLATLPRLTALSATIDGDQVEAALQSAAAEAEGSRRQRRAEMFRAILPPRLRRFTVCFVSSLAPTQALIDALPVLADLRTLNFDSATAGLDLSPLLQLPQLSSLYLYDSPSVAQCALIRNLSALTALHFLLPCRDPAALLELLRPPHSLQRLELITLSGKAIDSPLLTLLLSLPALADLRPESVAPECWAELSAFTQLRALYLSWPHGVITTAQRSALGSTLCALPLLTDLELRAQCELPRSLRLPALRRLHLADVSLPSFKFLQHCPLIESLQLSFCRQVDADDLLAALAAHPPPRLSVLTLQECHWLDGAVQLRLRAALDPPSALLPQLRSFGYSDPDVFW